MATQPWEYRVRAVNRAGEGVYSNPIAVVQRSDITTPKRPERLSITQSQSMDPDHNSGRTGLTLMWDKSTAQLQNDTPEDIDATAYRIEYSTTGPAEGGYNWRELEATVTAEANADRQSHTDGYIMFEDTEGTNPFLLGGQTRHYRVFAFQTPAQMSWPSVQKSGTTAKPLQPGASTALVAVGTGHTTIALTWMPPTEDVEGGDDVVIDNYVIQTWDADRRRWEEHKTTGGGGSSFTDEGLEPGETVKYRVSAVNSASSRAQYQWSNEAEATTVPLALPNEPGGLAVEGYGQNSIKLCWNSQAVRPEDAPVTSYLIEYSPDGKDGTWLKLADLTTADDDGNVHTIYTDSHQLEAGDTRHYRVFAINLRGQSDQSDTDSAATAAAMAPGAPTATLGTVTDTEINFSWTAASDGGSAVTGWIVEKAYGGSFLNEMRTNTDAFTHAQTWWDGLDCPAMVAAVMDDGTADMDNPFCAMYADLGETEEAEVERVFAARYFVIDDAAKNSYRQYNLLPETERMYRVAAVNGVGIGMWSNAITATTEQANAAPAAGAAIVDQTVTAGGTVMVQSTITDADTGDTLTWSVESDMPTYATAEVDDMGMVTITGVAEGMATITVTATDIADETATQDIMVTVEAAGTALTAPSGVVVSTSTFGDTKSISVTWDTTSIQNAEQIKVALFNSDVTALAKPLITINPANDRGGDTFSDVPDGTYYVTVASFRTGERHKLSLPLQEVTVE